MFDNKGVKNGSFLVNAVNTDKKTQEKACLKFFYFYFTYISD